MRALSLFLALSLAACGSGSTTDDGGTDGATNEGGGDGGCIDAVEGASCASSDVSCSLGDACCNGFFMCQSGNWVKEYPGCACQVATFACGTMTCDGSQLCKVYESGVDGGAPTYECADLPTACGTNESCACITDAGDPCTPTIVQSCTVDAGHITLDCMGQ